jgi:hypothetical protein
MSWAKLLGRYVTAEPPSKAELDNLRSIITRSLQDAVAPGLSADARFIMRGLELTNELLKNWSITALH